jgi:hypothetical protein
MNGTLEFVDTKQKLDFRTIWYKVYSADKKVSKEFYALFHGTNYTKTITSSQQRPSDRGSEGEEDFVLEVNIKKHKQLKEGVPSIRVYHGGQLDCEEQQDLDQCPSRFLITDHFYDAREAHPQFAKYRLVGWLVDTNGRTAYEAQS